MTAWTTSDIPDLSGHTAVITGANSGLGFVTARELARAGARVILAVRNPTAGQSAAVTIQEAVPGARLIVSELDLASLHSVRAFAARITDTERQLDLLVNNAGVVILGDRQTTVDGFELHFGTNLLGHFELTGRLLPLLEAAAAARVVSLSSISHKNATLDFDDLMREQDFSPSPAYGASKLANTVFGIELDRRLRRAGSAVISVLAHPGVTRSNLVQRAWGGRGALGQLAARLYSALATQPTDQGALPQLHAATAPGVKGGDFFGPMGRQERRGEVGKVHPSATAADPEMGRRLWSAAEELTGFGYLS